ncbi:hypothetical protein E1B28_003592 [Marasmius oreades]|uniref:F-box domain-containing protein n=1 Tax=Marasmius oreades TaxID=181124 RepID=A0A9P7UL21_9AGAR|nr:uncharacterized protein E1B28_003592 [Marasmius oreades]KAG7086075.1 hypothetical protein E1B28_003592 [Marasmius oreades]
MQKDPTYIIDVPILSTRDGAYQVNLKNSGLFQTPITFALPFTSTSCLEDTRFLFGLWNRSTSARQAAAWLSIKMGERASFLCERCQRQTEVPFLRPLNSNLLHSDYIPCETEVSQTTELLEEEARELKQLENDIAPLRRILEQMEAGKRRLEAQIAQRQSILSVQRRVPAELWGNIFAFACSFSSRDGYFLDIQDLEIDDYHMPEVLSMFPVTLSYVCSRWKAIATGCPKLWSSIRVEVFSKFSRREMFLVETFLDNSAGFPLNMAIIVPVTWLNDRPLDNYCLSIWELLTGQFSRCERLSIHVDNLRTLSTLKQPDLSFNNLKAFHFTTRTDRLEFNINIPFWQAIRQVPKLAELHAQAPLLLLCLVPISQLTTMTLNLEGVSNIADILPVLESARQLRSLTVLPGTDCEFNATKIRRVEMPSLRTLILLEDYPSIDSWDFSHGEVYISQVAGLLGSLQH